MRRHSLICNSPRVRPNRSLLLKPTAKSRCSFAPIRRLHCSTTCWSWIWDRRAHCRWSQASAGSRRAAPSKGFFHESRGRNAGEARCVRNNGDSFDLSSGAVVIAAITSCTNTSNPHSCWGWLLAKKAVEPACASSRGSRLALRPVRKW